MTEPNDEALQALLRQKMAFEIAAGIIGEEQLLGELAVIVEEELGRPDPAIVAELVPLVAEGTRARAVLEQTWTSRTLNDDLEDALLELGDRGIVGLHANGTTVQHGWAIAEAAVAHSAPDMRGTVFYHLQDLERAVRGEGLTLAFGAFDRAQLEALATSAAPAADEPPRLQIQLRSRNVEGHGKAVEDATRVIGEEIVAVLRRHGLAPTWDGSPHTRILLPPFSWQRRVHTSPPPRTGAMPALELASAPAAAPVCPDCEGRGWLPPLVAGDFSDFCWCKGGKRPRPAAPVATPEVAPAPPRGVETAVATEPDETPSAAPTAAPESLLGRLGKWLRGS